MTNVVALSCLIVLYKWINLMTSSFPPICFSLKNVFFRGIFLFCSKIIKILHFVVELQPQISGANSNSASGGVLGDSMSADNQKRGWRTTVAGATAGAAEVVFTMPLDVIKTTMQINAG